jgi:hypothetical protein
MSEVILATMSFIPPGMDGSCTVCLRHGTDIWRKTYRSQTLAVSEARSLGLLTPDEVKFVGVSMIDADQLRRLGFQKQSNPAEG